MCKFGGMVAEATIDIRMAFVRKVYAILSVQFPASISKLINRLILHLALFSSSQLPSCLRSRSGMSRTRTGFKPING